MEYNSGTCLRTFKGDLEQKIISLLKFNETTLISGSGDEGFALTIWNINSGQTLNNYKGHNGFVWSIIKISETTIASASDDGTIRIWSL